MTSTCSPTATSSAGFSRYTRRLRGPGRPKPSHCHRQEDGYSLRNRRPGLATTHGVRARHDQLTNVGCVQRLKLRPLFGTPCEVLVIIRDLKRHLLGYFVFHIIGKTARLVGAFVPVLCLHAFTHLPTIKPISTRRREFVDGNHQRAHSVNGPTRRVGEATGRELAVRHFCGAFPRPRNYIVSQQINVGVAMPYRAGRAVGKFGTVKRNRPMARNRMRKAKQQKA